jgi:MFS family permease
LLAEVAPEGRRGEAFGLHRGLDHAGAAVGPLVAAALVAWGFGAREVFFLAAIPGALSVILVLAVREPSSVAGSVTVAESVAVTESESVAAERRRFVAALSLFTLAHSSDALLLLRARELGVPDEQAPLLWFLLHVVRSGLAPLGGKLGDRIGHARAAALGWTLFGLTYAGFGAARAEWHAWALFAGAALHSALAEGPERALVARYAEAQRRGRAFGAYHLLTGGGSLAAGLLIGALWERFGAPLAFGLAAALAFAAAAVLLPARRPTAA